MSREFFVVVFPWVSDTGVGCTVVIKFVISEAIGREGRNGVVGFEAGVAGVGRLGVDGGGAGVRAHVLLDEEIEAAGGGGGEGGGVVFGGMGFGHEFRGVRGDCWVLESLGIVCCRVYRQCGNRGGDGDRRGGLGDAICVDTGDFNTWSKSSG